MGNGYEGAIVKIDGLYLRGVFRKSGYCLKDVDELLGRYTSYVSKCLSSDRMCTGDIERIIDMFDCDRDSVYGKVLSLNDKTVSEKYADLLEDADDIEKVKAERWAVAEEDVEDDVLCVRLEDDLLEKIRAYLADKWVHGVKELSVVDLMHEVDVLFGGR